MNIRSSQAWTGFALMAVLSFLSLVLLRGADPDLHLWQTDYWSSAAPFLPMFGVGILTAWAVDNRIDDPYGATPILGFVIGAGVGLFLGWALSLWWLFAIMPVWCTLLFWAVWPALAASWALSFLWAKNYGRRRAHVRQGISVAFMVIGAIPLLVLLWRGGLSQLLGIIGHGIWLLF